MKLKELCGIANENFSLHLQKKLRTGHEESTDIKIKSGTVAPKHNNNIKL